MTQRTVYDEMVEAMRARINRGDLSVGDRLPTESELAESFGISVRSVRSGIDRLVEEDLVQRRQGSGTYVKTGFTPATGDRDRTAAIYVPLRLRGYHPFYTEEMRGLKEGLQLAGYGIWEHDFGTPTDRDVRTYPADEAAIAERLASDDSLAGALVGGWLADALHPNVDPAFPMVALAESKTRPYVDYDWNYEGRRAIGCLEARGARRIWVLGGSDPRNADLRTHAEILWQPMVNAATGRQTMSTAYAATRAALEADPDIDGIVATDDFNGQGVFDALARLGPKLSPDLRLICIMNRHSRIHTDLAFQSLVVDGYLKGREIARLFDQWVREPENAPTQVILGCSLETPASLLQR